MGSCSWVRLMLASASWFLAVTTALLAVSVVAGVGFSSRSKAVCAPICRLWASANTLSAI